MARAQHRNRSAATKPSGERATWGPTALQREYRKLLDSAKQDAQLIIDSDGTGLVMQRKEDADFYAEMSARVAQAGRFLAVARANAGREPAEWANQTEFPYLASFDSDEVGEFARELLAYTFDAAQRGTLENLEGNLRAWKSSADIYEHPDVLAQMTADFDPADIVELHPPSEKAVETAVG